MNYMTREEWICPPSFTENVKPCAGNKTFSTKDDFESTTVASSSFSSPYQESEISDKVHPPKPSVPCVDSEELMTQKKDEERKCLKQTCMFLKLLAKKLKRGQTIVNTSMVYFLKYTRIYSFSTINKFLVASACFLLAAKCLDEPIPLDILVEWYIFLESKRISSTAKVDISDYKKQDYSLRIQEQEFDILCEIGFDTDVELPNKFIAQFAASPAGKTIFTSPNCTKFAYMFLNDSFMTTCPLFFTPKEIAAACLYMAHLYITANGSGASGSSTKGDLENHEWLKDIDESLDLSAIIEVKDEIKKCYTSKPSSS